MYILNHRYSRRSTISAGDESCYATGDERLTARWSNKMDGVVESQLQLRTRLKVPGLQNATGSGSSSMLLMTS
ncbi:unnamed protein product [Arctia plantaginis]|uniref:Uncharacterized protein n=1 Tax=Arctia plantaginis TaxID=874455 RepID=A0A8S0ZSF8_ARCPL|nr:unnamed protein product [Arctia plantaginis]CAB3235811.1 unnamed protein product [Arctia plantaginis]